jgi:hypothetical protein
MSDPEIHELLAWVSRETRTYPEAIEVWKTNCPRHSLWEDAVGDGLIQVVRNGRESHVALTPLGQTTLERASWGRALA